MHVLHLLGGLKAALRNKLLKKGFIFRQNWDYVALNVQCPKVLGWYAMICLNFTSLAKRDPEYK